MNSDSRMFRRLPSRKSLLRAAALAVLIVACEPVPDFYGSCGEFDPPCSERTYSVMAIRHVPGGDSPLVPTDSLGVMQLPSLPATFSLNDLPTATACLPRGGGGRAWALSCAGCDAYFAADSVFFTTDFIGPAGDTLKAGTALDTARLPSGVKFRGRNWVELDSGAVFGDSLFEVRFQGKVDGVPKTAFRRVAVPASLRAL
jgi:hypothetical protein